jgi:hypothetical protein
VSIIHPFRALTTAIGVYLQGTVHPRLAMGLYIVAGVLSLFTAVQWTWIQKLLGIYHEPSATPVPSSPVTSSSSTVTAPATATATGNVQKFEQHLHLPSYPLDEIGKTIADELKKGEDSSRIRPGDGLSSLRIQSYRFRRKS